jgi:dTDP-4-amino-4,6-dideoxy-D-galactose acyltransferase
VSSSPNAGAASEDESLCSYLEWDSNFFGVRIARLNRTRLDEPTANEALAWSEAHRIDCLYFLADPDHTASVLLAEKHEFLLVDQRMTLQIRVPNDAPARQLKVRPAREDDVATLKEIARQTHRDTRFYFDKHFERSRCDELYATWIENSFRGFAQAVLVAESDDGPAGYLTCRLKESESQIGLLGVGALYQGQGLGTQLVQQFLAWSREQKAIRATVVTQGRNLAAQRLYQRNGFVAASLQVWYHRWFVR